MNLLRTFTVPVRVLGLLLLLLTISRLLLVFWYWGRVMPTDGTWFILLQGIRFDIVLMGMIMGPALLAAPWVTGHRYGSTILRGYLALVSMFVLFVEFGTIPFIDQYDARPNYLYVEYLKYPREVFATVMASYGTLLVVVTLSSIGVAWLIWRLTSSITLTRMRARKLHALLITPLMLVMVLMMVRSTLEHRPVNPSTVAFSTDSMVNQLPLNSPYSLLYAIYEQHRDSRGGAANYGKMGRSDVLRIVSEAAGLDGQVDLESTVPSMHNQTATRRLQKPMNLVIILEESLGAEFVGSLGGKDLTPVLDSLAEKGIWFEQLYATGTRSVRGIEAVICDFLPTSKRSVVKLAETQQNFFTIAGLLKDKGYHTSFIYGGESHFDNMGRFFLSNGFQQVIDQGNYENPDFLGSWGVSDEDLLTRANQEFSSKGEQPFFSLVFTSSNHEPFDIPAGKVAPETGDDAGRDTAVKYADYAIGEYFKLAKQADYYKNTVFLVVSDHNSRVYGDQLVPIERFHIPGVILGDSIEPRRVQGITSQIDLLPTLLSLIGVDGRHPAIGHDLTLPQYRDGGGRAQMQFNSIQAWMEPGKVVVMQPDLPMKSFLYETGGRLQVDPNPDEELRQRALAHALWPVIMVKEKAYHP